MNDKTAVDPAEAPPPKTRVVLLDDVPSPQDQFSGKAHERVAEAIADLVKSEPGGRVIGLEGTWGSGKSTIVKLVQTNLSKPETTTDSPKTETLVFDAWAHQGDPLRRTFLESLMKSMRSWSWLTTDYELDTRKIDGEAHDRKYPLFGHSHPGRKTDCRKCSLGPVRNRSVREHVRPFSPCLDLHRCCAHAGAHRHCCDL